MSSPNRTHTQDTATCSCLAEDLFILRAQHTWGFQPVIPDVNSAYRARRATGRDRSEAEPRTATAVTRSERQWQGAHTRKVASRYLAWESLKRAHSWCTQKLPPCITFRLSLYHQPFTFLAAGEKEGSGPKRVLCKFLTPSCATQQRHKGQAERKGSGV